MTELRTAFIVRVPEAEAIVSDLRERFDESARMGVPAHVTILFPFMPPAQIDDEVLRRIRATALSTRGFAFSLEKMNRFPATAYLEPEPPEPFIELTENLATEFPDYPPFEGEFPTVIPHLTVAHGNVQEARAAESELVTTMATKGPIESFCSAIVLMENSSGRWKPMHSFPLAK